MRCMDCGAEMRETSEPITEKYKGRTITVTGIRHYACDGCGEYELEAGDADKLSRALATEYAKIQGLLLPAEIRAIRKRLGMTQAQFEGVMGVSTPTASRWETGAAMPSKTACILMRAYAQHPELLHERTQRGEVTNRVRDNPPIKNEWKVFSGGKATEELDTSYTLSRKKVARNNNLFDVKEG